MFIRGLSRLSVQLSSDLSSTGRRCQYQAIQHVARLSTMPLRDESGVETDSFSSNDLRMKIVSNKNSSAHFASHPAPNNSGITLIKHPHDLPRSTAVPEPIAPDNQLFAIFRLLGKQFKVTKVSIQFLSVPC